MNRVVQRCLSSVVGQILAGVFDRVVIAPAGFVVGGRASQFYHRLPVRFAALTGAGTIMAI